MDRKWGEKIFILTIDTSLFATVLYTAKKKFLEKESSSCVGRVAKSTSQEKMNDKSPGN